MATLPYRSPIDRGFLAELLGVIAAAGPRAVGIDLLFDQPTEASKDAALGAQVRGLSVPLVVAWADQSDRLTKAQTDFMEGLPEGIEQGLHQPADRSRRRHRARHLPRPTAGRRVDARVRRGDRRRRRRHRARSRGAARLPSAAQRRSARLRHLPRPHPSGHPQAAITPVAGGKDRPRRGRPAPHRPPPDPHGRRPRQGQGIDRRRARSRPRGGAAARPPTLAGSRHDQRGRRRRPAGVCSACCWRWSTSPYPSRSAPWSSAWWRSGRWDSRRSSTAARRFPWSRPRSA